MLKASDQEGPHKWRHCMRTDILPKYWNRATEVGKYTADLGN